jgi:hypothetical protein
MVLNFCTMPAKKKSKQKSTARSAGKAHTRAASAKTSRKTAKKKTAWKRTASRRRARGRTAESEFTQALQNRQRIGKAALSPQTDDLQGLSRAEEADSESVEELAGEGNVLEAGAVAGVEAADSADEKEVHTHELPEDDVPEEYLDQD